MSKPDVSFVVPCYKLAHLLPECINSILQQSYRNFEVLIMDDCSPDNTAEVARSFGDPRVQHIRNEPNLGHLRNYNKGIGLGRGRYIWLISADDYLRKAYILEQYISVLDSKPKVGYAFCSGVGVRNGEETGVLNYSCHGSRDRIFHGPSFLKNLVKSNSVLAASGMVRRECYERLGAFPLDMPWAGDWYLWCLFAIHYDVAYFAEPMVGYRTHEMSMTTKLWKEDVSTCCEEDVRIPWSIKRKADEAGLPGVSSACLSALAEIYARRISTKRYGMSKPSLTVEQFEQSLCRHTANEGERDRVRARAYAAVGNEYYWQGEASLAKKFYQLGLEKDPWMLMVRTKKLLLTFGKGGDLLRKLIRSSHQTS